MTNKIDLSPEGAAIANAIAKSLGVADGQIVPHARTRDRVAFLPHGSAPKGAQPALAIDASGLLYPTQLDTLVGVRLGLAIAVNDAGLIYQWSIVVRRDGERLCQIDYNDELICEAELETLRVEIDAWLTGGWPFEMFTKAIKITNFNPSTGGVL
jgi:hypothetical protein